ncbi:SRPBCC domain-containing protein [Paenibacillus koleovorans]|uniref:SRPBCC domain-containing protein n=1 Tax=Paenibacillus koleovorans TaxID=121608 RepID=UPI000FD73B0B|nr:SRPBCC domain-containing protein [Paenibacillus koleovorans]
MSLTPLKYEFYIDAPLETVWNTFISPEGVRQIFFGSELRSSFAVGEPYQYVGPGKDGDETVHVYGTILEYEPNKRISMTEHPGPSYWDNHAELQTRMTYTLETVYNCTKLTFVNDEWTDGHPSYERVSQDWWLILSNIKTLAETGKPMNFQW